MFLFLFFSFSCSVFSEDPINTIQKIQNILKFIYKKRVWKYIPAKNTIYSIREQNNQIDPSKMRIIPSDEIICSKINEDEMPISNTSDCLNWESFNISDDGFSFPCKDPYTWIFFQGDLAIDSDEIINSSEYSYYFSFDIEPHFDGQQWGDYFPAGPEGRIWLNGHPFGAIDEFHDGATLTEFGHVELRIFTGRISSHHTLNNFGISILHQETESLYETIRFLMGVLKEISHEKTYKYFQIVTILDKTVRMLDISEFSSSSLESVRKLSSDESLAFSGFYKSVHSALSYLKKSLDSLPKPTKDDPAISVIGYSHIDSCWMWPFNISRVKIVNTAISMLRLININKESGFKTRFSEFKENEFKHKFLATSAQHYKWIKEDDPEVFAKIIEEIRNGRWEANGAAWIEFDSNLPSGESLVRQLVMGIRFFDKEVNQINSSFHINQTVLFLPDCFGFPGNLPQIMRKAGLKYFVTSKISWSEYTTFPHSTFKWRGIDGSDVIAHFVSTPTYWDNSKTTYTGVSDAYELIQTLSNYKQQFILPTSALHTSGNGDGGGGITEQMLINMNIMNQLPRIPNVPRITSPSLTEMFEIISQKEDVLHVWDDELYLEYHRGTYTSQEEIKRQNRQIEALLHNCEWLSVILFSVLDFKLKASIDLIESFWEDALLLQFHDSLPGTSNNEANKDILNKGHNALANINMIEQILSRIIASTIIDCNKDNHTFVFNTLSHERIYQDKIVPSGGWTIYDSDLGIQYDDTETTINQVTKKLSYKIVSTTLNPFVNDSQKVKISKDSKNDSINVSTPFLSIIFTQNGTMKSVKDVKTGREFISSPCNLFELYEDRPLNFPAWDIQKYHKEMQLFNAIKFEGFEIISSTSIKLKFTISSSGNFSSEELRTSQINQTITFSEDSPLIDFVTDINWTEHDKLLKVAFPTTIRSKFARFGIQFGHITRPTHINTLRDFAKFETCGRWADLSDSTTGVALMSNVKSGFDVHENVIRMSLLKSSTVPDKWADFGIRKFSYRAVFHASSFEESNVVFYSDELVCPISVSTTNNETVPSFNITKKLPQEASFVKLDSDKIIMETLKLSYDNEKGFVVRVYESTGGWVKSKISFPLLAAKQWKVVVVDLLERPVSDDQNVKKIEGNEFLELEIELKPFELLSIMLIKLD